MTNSRYVFLASLVCGLLSVSPAFSQTASNTLSLGAWEWAGDLRYRISKTRENLDEERPFHQLRARMGFKGKVQEGLAVQMRLATATSALSQNQTLGDAKDPGMPRRNFGLDLGYADWFGSHGHLWIGRSPNPFFSPGQSQLLLDSDLAFEGFSYKWETKTETTGVFFNAGTFMISENYGSGASPAKDMSDTALIGAQAGLTTDVGIGALELHVGTQHYVNIRDKAVTTVDKDAKTDAASAPFNRFKGNTVYIEDPTAAPAARKYLFQNQFAIYETGFELKMPLAVAETTVYAIYAKNPLAPDQNEAFEGGVVLKSGRVSLSFAANQKRSDSVVGAFTDSDFNGGGADNKGERVGAGYKLGSNSAFLITYFHGHRGIDSIDRVYEGTQADFALSF